MLIFLILRHGTAMLAYIVIGFIFSANCAVAVDANVPVGPSSAGHFLVVGGQ
jgi:hypothetical protein